MSIIQKKGFGKLRLRKVYHPLLDIFQEYVNKANLDDEEHEKFLDKMANILVNNFTEWALPKLNARIIKVEDMWKFVFNQEFEDVYQRLASLLDIWKTAYGGPVNLGFISMDYQSIHIKEVENNTENGIEILGHVNIPDGQNTIREIEEAFASMEKTMLTKVIANMKDWGKRQFVMKADENVYRTSLRGLWAKIKTYDVETQKELINRLWEESCEALGMCADGQVGRLINVLVGFDDSFNSQISPMEYFQNNIAKISENTLSPLSFKIEQAKRLMDDIRMPEAERSAWLDAL